MWKKEIVQDACRKFQGDEATLKLLGGFYKNVYEYERNGTPCILKLIPIAAKDRSQLYSELEWISYLRKNGIPIPEQVLSANSQAVETIIKLPLPFCIVSFKKGKGEKINTSSPDAWNPRLLRLIGKIMGKIHSLSTRFHAGETVPFFEEWNEGEVFYRDLSYIEGWITDLFNVFRQKINTLPQTEQSYGLIHNDFQPGGFLVDSNDNITLYDFSHVKYHFFTYDIATFLFHALESVPKEVQNTYKHLFLNAFMEGYILEHHLEKGWQEQIDLFLEYRNLFLYIYLMTSVPPEKLDNQKKEQLNLLKKRLVRFRAALTM
ncbi:phosphotransferase enzyme family protein [Thermoactinomyces mirandus]|uniref:Phosphotransferase n=1 Tax=Thermoactinomyces mirandus TaxID=2756294 RepID=A0A7W1XUL7_9BACL|nr:phosphotransferase [Thermoactinomyces mirandus]MBA4603579.1 phosphotransferase [Thermoactinomyces mirandus]